MGRVQAESLAEAREGIRVGTVAREVARQALRDDVIGLSAELAYRFFIALFPFFIFMTALGGLVAAELQIRNPAQSAVELIGDVLPQSGAQFLEDQLRQVMENASRGQLVAGALFAVLISTSGTNAIIKGLNRAYGVKERRPFWRRYLTALLITLGAGTITVTAIVLVLPFRIFLEPSLATNALAAAVAVGLLIAAGAFLFRLGPNIKLPVRVVLPGAGLFAVLAVGASILFGLYVANFADYASTYGVLAGVVIVLVWFYVMSLALLLAAETNQVIHAMSDPADMAYRRREAEEESERDFYPGREIGVSLGAEEESDRRATAARGDEGASGA